MKYGIFTKPIHVEKIVNFLNLLNSNNIDEASDSSDTTGNTYYNDFEYIDYIISTNKKDIYAYDFDIGISYCWPWTIDVAYPQDLTVQATETGYREINKRTWYNYHPGPLPRYTGMESYAGAIHDMVESFGVTLHVMTMHLDRGPILQVKEFPLETIPVAINELGSITHYYLFQLFKQTIEILKHKPLTKEEFEKHV